MTWQSRTIHQYNFLFQRIKCSLTSLTACSTFSLWLLGVIICVFCLTYRWRLFLSVSIHSPFKWVSFQVKGFMLEFKLVRQRPRSSFLHLDTTTPHLHLNTLDQTYSIIGSDWPKCETLQQNEGPGRILAACLVPVFSTAAFRRFIQFAEILQCCYPKFIEKIKQRDLISCHLERLIETFSDPTPLSARWHHVLCFPELANYCWKN